MNKIIEYFYNIADILNLNSASGIVVFIFDLLLVTLIAIYVFRLIKKTRAEQIIKGIIILLILLAIASVFNMVLLKFLLTNLMTYGMLLFIVIFQPELRSAFEKIGRSKIVDVFDMDNNIYVKHSISEVVKAVEIMSLKKIGAIIVLEGNTKISDAIKDEVNLSAKVSSELLQNIFMPRTPLHDGAVVIDKNTIICAKGILPLASENAVERKLGTRHRAGVGITEISDAIAIIISEETGIISFAYGGKLTTNVTVEQLKEKLLRKLDKTKNKLAYKRK